MTEEEKLELENDTQEYADLLSQANYDRPKFNLLVRSLLKPGISLMQLIQSFNLIYELDNACGDQLDVLGEIIGASRLLNYVPASGDRVMDDDEFRLVLKLTIAQNTWDGTLGSIKAIYANALGSNVSIKYVDNQDMSVTISVYGDITTREIEILDSAGLLLVPAGVGKVVGAVGGSVSVTAYAGTAITGIQHTDCVTAT